MRIARITPAIAMSVASSLYAYEVSGKSRLNMHPYAQLVPFTKIVSGSDGSSGITNP
jgi:hypothetical protein